MFWLRLPGAQIRRAVCFYTDLFDFHMFDIHRRVSEFFAARETDIATKTSVAAKASVAAKISIVTKTSLLVEFTKLTGFCDFAKFFNLTEVVVSEIFTFAKVIAKALISAELTI